jgi:mannose/fructose/N-acetylgalactosamine-specific phosphotransferase system component IID
MGRLGRGVLWRVAMRANLLQATWNFERQQGVGWVYALQPVLEALYRDPEERRRRLEEHTAYFNTQPTLASLALGAVARLEEERAAGGGPDAAGMARVKAALGATLAALGDRLFWFSLRPFAAVLGVLVALARPDAGWGALVLWLCYASVHLGVRYAGVGWGYERGPSVLGGTLRAYLETGVTVLAYAGCIVVGVAVAWAMAPGGIPRPIAVQSALAGGLGLGLLSAQRARPSPTQWALGAGVLVLVAVWSHRF